MVPIAPVILLGSRIREVTLRLISLDQQEMSNLVVKNNHCVFVCMAFKTDLSKPHIVNKHIILIGPQEIG